ncbi:MarR family transcriptional regulator [uncultured Clostridium sp.]|uniref:MarR family winged helix-turn-helix transcriptional regulator n=1 Tax=uncultured Clostridium sp. TaxID=59620 RepID=UPI0026032617|nr:MarR family transcriptional regulator [uncultured Clostridium sp.]
MFKMDEGLGLLMNVIDKLMINTFNRKIKEKGINITFEQYTILTMLWDNENLCQYNLAELTNRDQASTSRLINTLIKNELIVRETSEKDKRVKNIKLTAKGEEIKDTVKSVVKESFNDAVKDVTSEEMNEGMNFLNKLRINLSEK